MQQLCGYLCVDMFLENTRAHRCLSIGIPAFSISPEGIPIKQEVLKQPKSMLQIPSIECHWQQQQHYYDDNTTKIQQQQYGSKMYKETYFIKLRFPERKVVTSSCCEPIIALIKSSDCGRL